MSDADFSYPFIELVVAEGVEYTFQFAPFFLFVGFELLVCLHGSCVSYLMRATRYRYPLESVTVMISFIPMAERVLSKPSMKDGSP